MTDLTEANVLDILEKASKRGRLFITSREYRLANVLSRWARTEIAEGFKEFQSVSRRVGGKEHEMVRLGGYRFLEEAARDLVASVKPHGSGLENTHVLVWRILPEVTVGKTGPQAYARFSFVPIGETGDCEEIAP